MSLKKKLRPLNDRSDGGGIDKLLIHMLWSCDLLEVRDRAYMRRDLHIL